MSRFITAGSLSIAKIPCKHSCAVGVHRIIRKLNGRRTANRAPPVNNGTGVNPTTTGIVETIVSLQPVPFPVTSDI